jgi:uncharacterized caspase-like protein
MGKRLAAVIGIENYRDAEISRVKYARADAEEISNAFDAIGFARADQLLLLDADATKTTIESRLDDHLLQLRADDDFFFFFAGHGISFGADTHLLCHDTDLHQPRTAIELKKLMTRIKEANCDRSVLFLDACHSGMTTDPSMRSIISRMSDAELKAFAASSKYCMCFASSAGTQKSFGSPTLKHGIWTYHVLRAFRGEEPLAIERPGLITSNSLQNYLANAVPASVRATFTDTRKQTPQVYGVTSSEFVIADIRPLLEARKPRGR